MEFRRVLFRSGGWVGRASTGRYATVTTPCRKPNGERRPFNLSWEKSVTNKNLKAGRVLPRPLTLAAATAVALSTAFAASAAERLDPSALPAGGRSDRFIVQYRDGRAEYSHSPSRVQSLSRASRSRAMSKKSLRRCASE